MELITCWPSRVSESINRTSSRESVNLLSNDLLSNYAVFEFTFSMYVFTMCISRTLPQLRVVSTRGEREIKV